MVKLQALAKSYKQQLEEAEARHEDHKQAMRDQNREKVQIHLLATPRCAPAAVQRAASEEGPARHPLTFRPNASQQKEEEEEKQRRERELQLQKEKAAMEQNKAEQE